MNIHPLEGDCPNSDQRSDHQQCFWVAKMPHLIWKNSIFHEADMISDVSVGVLFILIYLFLCSISETKCLKENRIEL